MLQDIGAMLDDGMVYWDVRPSAKFPTVEVRVADVPATVAETVLFATLVRALRDDRARRRATRRSRCAAAPHVLRAAYWRAARDGLDGDGVDLTETHAAVPAVDLLDRLVDRVRPALNAVGDYDDGALRTGPRRRGRQRSDAAAAGVAAPRTTSPTSSPRRPPRRCE